MIVDLSAPREFSVNDGIKEETCSLRYASVDQAVSLILRLPFGLCSAPKIFTAVADMLAWAIHCEGVRYVFHYLDDFLLLGSPGSLEAEQALSSTLHTFHTLAKRRDWLHAELSFLGILIDTGRFQLRLPADELARLRLLVAGWQSKRSCTRNKLVPCSNRHPACFYGYCLRFCHRQPGLISSSA